MSESTASTATTDPRCNIKKNGQEYYSQIYNNESAKKAGYGMIILSLCCCLICLCLSMSSTFGLSYKYYKDADSKLTAGVIILIIIGICSLSSVFSNFGQMFRSKGDSEKILSEDQDDGIRPCYSEKEKKVIN
jgi:hypothetical protein